MKITQINTTCGVGSTGKICIGISQTLSQNGAINHILYSHQSNGYKLGIPTSNSKYVRLQAVKSKFSGNYGFNSDRATRKLIRFLKECHPDIVHLHNIHSHDCNLELLFKHFKEQRTRLVWTFHDCWAFTGYCPHFTMAKCSKWKTHCGPCVQQREYSLFFDKSRKLFQKKRELFSDLELTIVTPSQWLSNLVKQSFLGCYPVHVINNGIDLSVFKPTESGFRKQHGLKSEKILLGVSFGWDERKGLDVFIELARRLPEDYRIVLVGTSARTDSQLPDNILSIHRTNNQQELASIYSAADLFINPTREENYPTVNMEALACGTPVLTFRTGGSPEILDETCGSVVDCDDVDELEREIIRICAENPYSSECCVARAKAFDQNERFKEYIELYERIDSARTERN